VHLTKVRSPIPWVYAGFYTMYDKDIGDFQILYSQLRKIYVGSVYGIRDLT
jgi:hypothetical protein